MADLIRCDVCGKERREDEPSIGWLRIERTSRMLLFGDASGPWDFCSWEHVRDYAARQVPVRPRFVRPLENTTPAPAG